MFPGRVIARDDNATRDKDCVEKIESDLAMGREAGDCRKCGTIVGPEPVEQGAKSIEHLLLFFGTREAGSKQLLPSL